MSNEHQILGPPGTGKTTYLARQIERAAEKHGPENIVVASYTKAAASVLNRRNLPIPKENIGTLHALCYRGLKNYEIAEVNAATFNEQNEGDAISLSSNVIDEMAVDASYATEGDKHLNTYNLYRAKCMSWKTMPTETINWVRKW
jgi:superfamily I DNA/RNA helicase